MAAFRDHFPTSALVDEEPVSEKLLRVFFFILYGGSVIVAIIGNLLVAGIVLTHRRMRTAVNFHLVNISLADILLSVFVVMFQMVYIFYNNWKYTRDYCSFAQFIFYQTVMVKAFTLLLFGINRYFVILSPRPKNWNFYLLLTILLSIWVIASALSLPVILMSETSEIKSSVLCYIKWPLHPLIYDGCFSLVTYIIPLLVLISISCYMLKKLEHRPIESQQMPMDLPESVYIKRVEARMLLTMALIYGGCWFPYHVYSFMRNLNSALFDYRLAKLIINLIAMSSTMYYPLVYSCMNESFRRKDVTYAISRSRARPIATICNHINNNILENVPKESSEPNSPFRQLHARRNRYGEESEEEPTVLETLI